tara:strand:+ start:1972 stop:2247 length:276 start_codon:yes stop_codon:yes gene_type:complete
MKFKILKDTDFDYDIKDKNMITYSKWIRLRKVVGENPKRMTFNPLEVELQKCYEHWLRERRIWLFERVYFPFAIAAFFIFLIYGITTGGVQ